MSVPGPSPAERSRLRMQLVVAPLLGGSAGVAVGLLLLSVGDRAPVPWWPFLLGGLFLLGYALLVGRRLVGPRPKPHPGGGPPQRS